MTAGPPAADSVAGQQTQTFHISTAATAVDISQLWTYLQGYYKGLRPAKADEKTTAGDDVFST
ncbi:MAG TPA: hypothetical protein VF772_04210, partial [Terriglobales bacterium]